MTMGFGRQLTRFAAAAFPMMMVLSGGLQPAQASEIDASLCPISMNETVTLEREQIQHLFRERGLDYDLTQLLASDLQGSVQRYLSHRQSHGDARDRALLFFIGNSRTLCAMFWRIGDGSEDSVFIVERLAVPPVDIVPLIDAFVQGMQDADAGTLRQALPRDAAATEMTRGAIRLKASTGRAVPDLLAELSHLLFPGAIADHVGDLASLTIIPCLNIGIVPFAALDPDRDGKRFVEVTAINVEAELRHVYENRAFAWDGNIKAPVLFGDPDAVGDPDWSFPRLPGAAREIAAIAERFDAMPLVGSAVTPELVADRIVDADYVHIAAHGLRSVDNPLDGSFLALHGGRLTARQILGLGLRESPLVILSACQTGLGGPLDAGIVGLARSFVIAGASATVSTLWNVDDDATEGIMVDFVENLGTMSPAEALRHAQMKTRERYLHPRYWAGFTVFGSRMVPNQADKPRSACRSWRAAFFWLVPSR
ncbi:MAG: CHAT domain-containing protein [Rhizobiaceae bacterium]|nr:CHAT domain-containing protein [Rhizobiaceae bacterium]